MNVTLLFKAIISIALGKKYITKLLHKQDVYSGLYSKCHAQTIQKHVKEKKANHFSKNNKQ